MSADAPRSDPAPAKATEISIHAVKLNGEELETLIASPADDIASLRRRIAEKVGATVNAVQLLWQSATLEDNISLARAGLVSGAVVSVLLVSSAAAVVPNGWHGKAKGASAIISEDGRTVRRMGRKVLADSFEAIVIARMPVREFTVKILDSSGPLFGGMEIGFLSMAPDELRGRFPRKAASLSNSWISSGDGQLYVDGRRDPAKQDGRPTPPNRFWQWTPESMEQDQQISCYAPGDGQLCFQIDGETVVSWTTDIPDDAQLFPVIGVHGRVRAIELLPPSAEGATA